MSMVVVAVVAVALMAFLAIRANARFRTELRIPMQWSADRQVIWSAPRGLGLAFMPVIGTLVMIWFVAMALTTPPRPGQAGLVLPVEIVIGLAMLGCQWLHIVLVARTLRRRDG